MERRVKLTDDQFERLVLEHRAIEKLGEVVAALVTKVSEEAAKKEQDLWKSVRHLAGVEHCGLTINWISRELIVKEDEGGA